MKGPSGLKKSQNCSKVKKELIFLHLGTLVVVLTHQSFLSCVVGYVQVYYRKSRPLGASLRTPKGSKMVEYHLMFFFFSAALYHDATLYNHLTYNHRRDVQICVSLRIKIPQYPPTNFLNTR